MIIWLTDVEKKNKLFCFLSLSLFLLKRRREKSFYFLQGFASKQQFSIFSDFCLCGYPGVPKTSFLLKRNSLFFVPCSVVMRYAWLQMFSSHYCMARIQSTWPTHVITWKKSMDDIFFALLCDFVPCFLLNAFFITAADMIMVKGERWNSHERFV